MTDRAEIKLEIKDLPKAFRNFTDQVPFAGSRALNDTAKHKVRQMKEGELRKYLTLRNRHTERGMRVDFASKANPVVKYGSIDWYFERQVSGDTNRARIGIKFKGRRYLFTPTARLRTRTGKLKRLNAAGRPPFVIQSKKGDVLLVRRRYKGRRYPLEVMGHLTVHQTFKAQVPWERISLENVDVIFERAFRRNMVRAIRTAKF